MNRQRVTEDVRKLGIAEGDVVLVRASMRSVGRIPRQEILAGLRDAVGPEGTVVSLAFTASAYLWRATHLPPVTVTTPSTAGALPNTMLDQPEAIRSRHPQCSVVAIGRLAAELTSHHGPSSPAYAPIRKLIERRGKMLLIGCVTSSPGFTTAHLAEYDLGLHRRAILSDVLSVTPYIDEQGQLQTFRRCDPGLCSNSYWKFYSHYVNRGVLHTGHIGSAYSIAAPAKECYDIEHELLARNPRFNVCDDPMCATCNALRWDRLHHLPLYVTRKFAGILSRKLGQVANTNR